MLIFNTTFHVDEKISDDYLNFFTEKYIPTCAASGFLFEPRFAKITSHSEQGSVCYSLQFYAKNEDSINYWLTNGGKQLEGELVEKFGQRVVGFITLMEEVAL